MMTFQLNRVKSASRIVARGTAIGFLVLLGLTASAQAGWFKAEFFNKAKPFIIVRFDQFEFGQFKPAEKSDGFSTPESFDHFKAIPADAEGFGWAGQVKSQSFEVKQADEFKFGQFKSEQFKFDGFKNAQFEFDAFKNEPFNNGEPFKAVEAGQFNAVQISTEQDKADQFHQFRAAQFKDARRPALLSATLSNDFLSLNAARSRQPFESNFADKAEADKRSVYYTEYADSEGAITGKRYRLPKERKELVVYSNDPNVKANVEANQVVRILAKAEAGETLWVFIGTAYHPGMAYAKSYAYGYGSVERLQEFDPYASYAYRMYYVKSCDDNLVDLGYGDYSKLAGYSGAVTITVKKGEDPKDLKTIQTINLSYK